MHNFVLSPIDPNILIDSIVERVTANILNAVRNKPEIDDLQEKPLTIQQAGELLNLSVPTLYSKVSKGELPVMKRGNRLYFSRIELIEYLKAGKRKSSAEIDAEADSYFSNKKGLK